MKFCNRIPACFLAGIFFLVTQGCGETKQEAKVENTPVVQPVNEPIKAEFVMEGLNGGACKFIGVVGATNYLVDSMVAGPDGRLLLQRDTALPSGLYFLLLPNDQNLQFILDKDQTFTLRADIKDIVGSAKTEGSLDMDLLYENLRWEAQFQKDFQPVSQRFNAAAAGSPEKAQAETEQRDLLAKRKAHIQSFKDRHPNAFFTQYKLAGQNPELKEPKRPDGSLDVEQQLRIYRDNYWDNTPFSDERLLHTPIIANKLTNYITQLTPQAMDSVIKFADIVIAKSKVNKEMFKFVVNWIAIEYNKPKNMGGEAVFVHVVDKYFTDDQAFWSNPEELAAIRKTANEMRPSLMGKIGQDLNCKNLKGEMESIYGLKAPWTVVWIWNYECEHCQERTPAMKKVLERYRSRGLEVYSLCTGMEEKPWRDFVAKYGIQSFHNVIDPQQESRFYQKYQVDNTPELYLLDKDHRIVAKDLHPDQLPAELDLKLVGK